MLATLVGGRCGYIIATGICAVFIGYLDMDKGWDIGACQYNQSLVGGHCNCDLQCGAPYLVLSDLVTWTSWSRGACLVINYFCWWRRWYWISCWFYSISCDASECT